MTKPIAFFDEPTDFSLVQGGPLFQLLLRAGLARPAMGRAKRRMLVIGLIAWLPLLVLSGGAGRLVGGEGVSFLYDLGAHVRLLLCIPLLIAAEVVVHKRMKVTVRQFLDRGIIAADDRPGFEDAIASAMRLRNSMVAEMVLLGITIAGAMFFGQRHISMNASSWYAVPAGDQVRLTAAGCWYFFVSLTIFRFLLIRWYFRLFVWYRFLGQVSRRVPLQINALHPDRAGGLAFLAGSMFAFQPVLMAHTVGLAGILGGKIWHEGATLPQFKMELVAWMAFLLLLVLTPLFFFMGHLATAKRTGLREYGIVASRYVAEFRRKWIATQGHAPTDEPLVGTADIQSLADLSGSFEAVTEMKIVPFGKSSVMRLAMMVVLPLSPLLLTMIPLEQLIDRALGMLI